MSTLAKSQAFYDAEREYEDAVRHVRDHTTPERFAGAGYLRELRQAVKAFKSLGGDVAEGERLLKDNGY